MWIQIKNISVCIISIYLLHIINMNSLYSSPEAWLHPTCMYSTLIKELCFSRSFGHVVKWRPVGFQGEKHQTCGKTAWIDGTSFHLVAFYPKEPTNWGANANWKNTKVFTQELKLKMMESEWGLKKNKRFLAGLTEAVIGGVSGWGM